MRPKNHHCSDLRSEKIDMSTFLLGSRRSEYAKGVYRRGNLRSKYYKNRIFDKILFLIWFGLVLRSDSESAWKIMQICSLRSWFGQNLKKNDVFINSFFLYFLIFERYFKVREYQNRTQHEKNTPGVLSLDFFARWEARTAPRNLPGDPLGTLPWGSPWEFPWGRKLL